MREEDGVGDAQRPVGEPQDNAEDLAMLVADEGDKDGLVSGKREHSGAQLPRAATVRTGRSPSSTHTQRDQTASMEVWRR